MKWCFWHLHLFSGIMDESTDPDQKPSQSGTERQAFFWLENLY
jgi:hypothetical protein